MPLTRSPSGLILIAVNLIPLFGVLYLDWQLLPLLFLFWFENVIIGVFNLLKILTCKPLCPVSWAARLFLAPFFTFHYGMFTVGHGIFLFAMFGQDAMQESQRGQSREPFGFIEQLIVDQHLFWPLLAMALSHGFSFFYNFLIKGEFLQKTPGDLMVAPYGRIAILHITILIGGFATQMLGEPIVALLLLVILKTGMDLAAHLREHRTKEPSPNSETTSENPNTTS